MRQELADRHAGLQVHSAAEVQAFQRLAETAFAEYVVRIDIGYMTAISVEHANGELVAEQSEIAGDEIEQRTDGRIGLAVVIAEMSFEIAGKLRDAPVGQQLPIVR